MLPKTAGSAQTQKSMSFIWIVWSTLYVYLWKGAGTCSHGKWPTDQTKTHGVYLDLHPPNKNKNNNLAHEIQQPIPKPKNSDFFFPTRFSVYFDLVSNTFMGSKPPKICDLWTSFFHKMLFILFFAWSKKGQIAPKSWENTL